MIPLRDDNPTRITPFVTVGIIAANIFFFLLQFSQDVDFTFHWGAVPRAILFGSDAMAELRLPQPAITPPLTIFSSMFLHGGILHILGNMLFLWVFGDNVEEAMGHLRYILFYLTCGFIAAISHILLHPSSAVPMIGASGAISGVLGAYIVLHPHARVHTLIFLFFFIQIVQIPAAFFLGFWFLFQVLRLGTGGGVAWLAHVGGFLAGLALVKIFAKEKKEPKIYRVH